MNQDYRDVCAALVDAIDSGISTDRMHLSPVMFRARALLAEPPSRKEQALEAIGRLCASVIHDDLKNDAAIVRRALEQLPDAL